MAEQYTALPSSASQSASDPAVFKVLDNGTVLYKTYQQAESARVQRDSGKSAVAVNKLSLVKSGGKHLTKEGKLEPYTLGNLVEFQFTGLIVVIVVLAGLSLLCMAIGRLIMALERTMAAAPASSAASAATAVVPVTLPTAMTPAGIHPGLSDQQLIVLLTAAASEAVGAPVRVGKFRSATANSSNWSAIGRSDLHSHRLK